MACQLIYDQPLRQNDNLFHGNGGNFWPSKRSLVMAEQDLTCSLSKAVSQAISKTVSAVFAWVRI